MIDVRGLSQTRPSVVLFVAAVPDVASLTEEINAVWDAVYVATDLMNVFFSIPTREEDQKQVLLSPDK